MLEREVFASYYILQRGRVQSPQFHAGVVSSLIVHGLAIILSYPVGLGPGGGRYAAAGSGPGTSLGQVVEVTTRPVFPSPKVVQQLLEESPSATPARPEFIAARSSVARGQPNPNPSGGLRLPKGGGEGRAMPASGAAGRGASRSSSGRVEEATEASRTTPPGKKKKPKVIESTDRMPTVVAVPTPGQPGESGDSQDTKLPAEGEGPDLAALAGTNREGPPSLQSSQSPVTLQGPISVNAKGVGAVEAYRAYLEQAIQRHWQIPPEANLLTRPISLTIEFEIAKDGRVLAIRLYNSTRNRALDRAAIRAIESASPFRPLPGVFARSSQLFTDTFVYYPPPSN